MKMPTQTCNLLFLFAILTGAALQGSGCDTESSEGSTQPDPSTDDLEVEERTTETPNANGPSTDDNPTSEETTESKPTGTQDADTAPPFWPGSAEDGEVLSYRQWSLIGDEVTPGDPHFQATVRPPEGSGYVEAWIDGVYAGRFPVSDSVAVIRTPVNAVPPGSHAVLVSADGSDTAFAGFEFFRSHPFYVFVTNDWDNSDNTARQYRLQETLHANHPELVMTHFVGPYTFTDPAVSQARRTYNVEWLHGMRDDHGDEIGLHIHPYCHFVNTTSVTCRTQPTFGTAKIDRTGYGVMLWSYTKDEVEVLLDEAIELFEQNDLGTPMSFRAGGWTAKIHTLLALANKGFVVDSSANNWPRLEEWQKYEADLYPWNKEAWSTIGDTSQPYYPSLDNILTDTAPALDILEVPDNGSLADYVTTDEMVEIFQKNWPGGPLDETQSLVIGYHPPSLDWKDFFSRIDGALEHIDQFLYVHGNGPVIYEMIRNAPRIWPKTLTND
ncbi:MAG: hypothetical protein MUC50_13700 [Myxococcota bacterium]|jgi:hypothetical protein|nr:hypothetical protein [Myxococcota bacterium]